MSEMDDAFRYVYGRGRLGWSEPEPDPEEVVTLPDGRRVVVRYPRDGSAGQVVRVLKEADR